MNKIEATIACLNGARVRRLDWPSRDFLWFKDDGFYRSKDGFYRYCVENELTVTIHYFGPYTAADNSKWEIYKEEDET